MTTRINDDVHAQIEKMLRMAKAQGEHERMMAVQSNGVGGGGLTGPKEGRWLTTFWGPPNRTPDEAINPDLDTAYAQVDELLTTTPVAAGAHYTKSTMTVGSGPSWVSKVDADLLGLDVDQAFEWQQGAMREYKLAMESPWIDVTRNQVFPELVKLVWDSADAKGDVFLVFTRKGRPDLPYRLAFEVIEAEYCCNPDNLQDGPMQNGNYMSRGIEMRPDGEPVNYWFASRKPGDMTTMEMPTWTAVRAFRRNGRPNVLHFFSRRRPGQTRGWSAYVTVSQIIKQLGNYTDAEVDAAVRAALGVLFITTDNLNNFGPTNVSALDLGQPVDAAKGEDPNEKVLNDATGIYPYIRRLTNTEKVESPTPGRPNEAFGDFCLAVFTQIGMALRLPVEVLLQRFTNSFSAASAAVAFAHEFVIDDQTHLNRQICDPCVREWMAEAVFRNRLRARRFFSDPLYQQAWCGGYWQYKPKPIILEHHAANAAKTRLEAGITSKSYETRSYNGRNWAMETAPDLVKENAIMTEAGMGMQQPAATEPVSTNEDGS